MPIKFSQTTYANVGFAPDLANSAGVGTRSKWGNSRHPSVVAGKLARLSAEPSIGVQR
jgi:hypothetical protein